MTENYKFRRAILSATKLWNITNFVMLFQAVMKFCLDLSRSKFWLIGDWSIDRRGGNLSLKIKSKAQQITLRPNIIKVKKLLTLTILIMHLTLIFTY